MENNKPVNETTNQQDNRDEVTPTTLADLEATHAEEVKGGQGVNTAGTVRVNNLANL